MKLSVRFSLMLSAALALPTSLPAADFGPGADRFRIAAGWFPSNFDTTVRVDNKKINIGDEINLERDLGLDDTSNAFYGAFLWRFKKRHRLSVSYYDFSRKNSAKAKRELEIGDTIVPAGAKIETEFDLEVFPIAYQYSFVQSEKIEFSGNIGLHWTNVGFGIEGKGFIGEEDVREFDEKADAKASAPLPLLGLGFDYWFTPRWLAKADGQYFYLSLSDDVFDYSGSLSNLRIATEYVPYRGLGLGVAVNWFKMDVDVEDPDWYGRLEYEYWGPQLYLSYRFR
jgi:hypothetical protein